MLSRPSPHAYTSITHGYMKAQLVCEEYRMPVGSGTTANPGDSWQTRSSRWAVSCCSVGINWSTYLTSASEVFLVGSVKNSLITDTHTGHLSEVNLPCSRSFVAVLKSHLLDVAVLVSSYTACTALTRASNISTSGLEVILKSSNYALADTECCCYIQLRGTILQHMIWMVHATSVSHKWY